MAQTYTIDEAAGKLGLTAEEFKRRWKTEWTSVRTFRDGGTVRFRSADIDELARTLGMASEPDLQLAEPSPHEKPTTEFLLPDDSAVGDDIFTIDPSDSAKKKAGKPADSDIRLEADQPPSSRRKRAAQEGTPTEELSIDLGTQPPSSGSGKKGSASSGSKLKAAKSGPNLNSPSSGKLKAAKKDSDSSSEFELSLDSDSDSFELTLNPDGSDEVDLGGSQVGKARAGQSGINLERPADSGINLERDSDEDFDLALEAEPTSASGRKLTGPKSVKIPKGGAAADSDSEFELTLDENSGVTDSLAADAEKGDIFETDFELPANAEEADSSSEVVAVENSDTDLENSDFDLALDESDIQAEDESASQVVLLDDPGSDEKPAKGKSGKLGLAGGGRKSRPADEDDAIDLEDDDASSALRDVPKKRRGDDEEDQEDLDPSRAAAAYKPKPWGILPAAVLLPAFILTFLGGLMSYELLRGMWSYNNGTKPTGTLVRTVAGWFDMDPKD